MKFFGVGYGVRVWFEFGRRTLLLAWVLMAGSCTTSTVVIRGVARPVRLTHAEVGELKMLRSLELPISGEWKNLHENDPGLAGVEISQAPREGQALVDESDSYIGKHPAEVVYHFWDGRMRSTGYYPDGRIRNDQWFPNDGTWEGWLKRSKLDARSDAEGFALLRKYVIKEAIMPYIDSWAAVRFEFGSDPNFVSHKDPRVGLIDALNAYEARMPPAERTKIPEIQ